MTDKQRQHWQNQKRRAEQWMTAYGASTEKAREIAERAEQNLGTNLRRSAL